jgi:CBS domain-containing protein
MAEEHTPPHTVKDVMIPLSEHPHVPYWLTIRQAMVVLREIAVEKDLGKYYEPTLLVFDEEYRLLGILRRRHLLAAVEPKLLDPTAFHLTNGQCLFDEIEAAECHGRCLQEDLFGGEFAAATRKKVGEVMTPIKAFAAPDDCIVKALYTMIQADVGLLPVMDEEKVLGVVRWSDLFNEALGMLLDR